MKKILTLMLIFSSSLLMLPLLSHAKNIPTQTKKTQTKPTQKSSLPISKSGKDWIETFNKQISSEKTLSLFPKEIPLANDFLKSFPKLSLCTTEKFSPENLNKIYTEADFEHIFIPYFVECFTQYVKNDADSLMTSCKATIKQSGLASQKNKPTNDPDRTKFLETILDEFAEPSCKCMLPRMPALFAASIEHFRTKKHNPINNEKNENKEFLNTCAIELVLPQENAEKMLDSFIYLASETQRAQIDKQKFRACLIEITKPEIDISKTTYLPLMRVLGQKAMLINDCIDQSSTTPAAPTQAPQP